MFVIDDLEHEGEEGSEDLVAVLKVEAHVERLDVRKVLQEVKVPGNNWKELLVILSQKMLIILLSDGSLYQKFCSI